jgi:hypothetical protein
LTSFPSEWALPLDEPHPDKNGNWTARRIVGPSDALLATRIRELTSEYLRWGKAEPMDLFLLSLSEPPTRKVTQIGGVPYRDRSRPWPRTPDGEPIPFLAQFDFSESRDIVGDVPADMLLIFGRPEQGAGLTFEWQGEVFPPTLIRQEELPVVSSSRQIFYGTRWRTNNYPDWEPLDEDSWSDLELPDGSTVHDLFFAIGLLGVAIGPSPFLPATSNLRNSQEKILCSLPTIIPTSNVRFPFLGHPNPIHQENIGLFKFDITAILDDDSFGLLYITESADGSLGYQVESL